MYRFLPLALGLIYMGHRENIEAVIAALDALAEPYKLPAQTMVQVRNFFEFIFCIPLIINFKYKNNFNFYFLF